MVVTNNLEFANDLEESLNAAAEAKELELKDANERLAQL